MVRISEPGLPGLVVVEVSDDLCFAPASELVAGYRSGKLSPVEAIGAVLDRIEKTGDILNAFVLVCAEDARRQARESEARWHKGEPVGILDGVPTTVKDVFDMAGHPTRRGSKTTAEDAVAEDAPPVARLREAGAVFLGKTTTPEFGWKGVTDSPLTGITRNPWDLTRTPGGSSGGAAAAVAAGLGTLALGGDGGGSIHIPASFCGVFGLKPTAGRIPHYPRDATGSCTSAGPITRDVGDAAWMMNVLAKPDPRDPIGSTAPADDYLAAMEDGVMGLRIAYSSDLGYAQVEEATAAAVQHAAGAFEDLGASLDPVGPIFDNPHDAFTVFFRAAIATFYRGLDATQREVLDPGFAEMGESGLRIDLTAYLEAEAVRRELATRVNLLFAEYDLLLTPQLSVTAFDVGCDYPARPGKRSWLGWSPFTYPFNFSGHPAASAPCGLDGEGLPIGMQIVGARGADGLVLRACRAYERASPFPRLRV